jgi:alpha-N-arabinofuranosidase
MRRFSGTRRKFLKQACNAGIAGSATALFGRSLFGATASGQSTSSSGAARVYVDSRRTIAPLDRNLFGSFLEHLGRAIYEGVYDPGSKLSDANGFRKDVLDEIRKMGVPIIRYPGGNFVSGYNWLDGVGPKKDRPRTPDKASNKIESNPFGNNHLMA